MSKRTDRSSGKQKIVPFPGLKERLVEKGLELLQNQHHEKAIHLLTEAYEMDQTDPVSATSLAVALYEDRKWNEAKALCEKMLHEGLGDYEEILELYIMNLIQLKEHDEIVTTIQSIIEENVLSPERKERFEHLLSMSMRQEQQSVQEQSSLESFVFQKDLEQQMIQVATLSKQNIHPIKKDLIDAIDSKQTHPFIKTMVLNILREQSVHDKVKIEKWGQSLEVIPAKLLQPFEDPFFQEVTHLIQQEVESENPSLADLAIDISKRHLFLLYPFKWIEENTSVIAHAYLHLAQRYMGDKMEWNENEREEIRISDF